MFDYGKVMTAGIWLSISITKAQLAIDARVAEFCGNVHW